MKLVLSLFWMMIGYSYQRRPRLTNDDRAEPGEFPFMVSLSYENLHHCGGALVSERHVLTAAHCVVDEREKLLKPSKFKVVAGSTNLLDSTAGTTLTVQRISIHPNFTTTHNPDSLINDIAVVILGTGIIESSSVKPIELQSSLDIRVHDESVSLLVLGFGLKYLNEEPQLLLKKLELFLVNKSACQDEWWKQEKLKLQPTQLCALSRQGDGICYGDSGGPLIKISEVNQPILVGIASGNTDSGCALGVPDIYTDVLQFLDYVKSVIME